MPQKKIGVLDSGLGGLTILRPLSLHVPAEYYYCADLKNLPYGSKTNEELLALTKYNVDMLVSYGVETIVIACHTLCSTIFPMLQKLYPTINFIDVVEPVIKNAVAMTTHKRIGIMATEATIKSHAHKQRIVSLDPSIEVIEQSCPLLASLIEECSEDDNQIHEIVRQYSKSLAQAKIDTLILGCTHYALIKDCIRSYLPVTIVSAEDNAAMLLEVKDFHSSFSKIFFILTKYDSSFLSRARGFITVENNSVQIFYKNS